MLAPSATTLAPPCIRNEGQSTVSLKRKNTTQWYRKMPENRKNRHHCDNLRAIRDTVVETSAKEKSDQSAAPFHTPFTLFESSLIGGNTTKVGEKNYDMKTLLRTVQDHVRRLRLQLQRLCRRRFLVAVIHIFQHKERPWTFLRLQDV